MTFNFNLIFKRNYIILLHDILAVFFAVPIAYVLRIGKISLLFNNLETILVSAFIFTLIYLILNLRDSLHTRIWRYFALPDFILMGRNIGVAIILSVPLLFFINRLQEIPRSLFIIQGLLAISFLCISRLFYRLYREKRWPLRQKFWRRKILYQYTESIPIILLGVDHNAELFIRSLQKSKTPLYHIVAIIDWHDKLSGMQLYNLPIYGSFTKLAAVVEKLQKNKINPHKIIVADENPHGNLMQQLLAITSELGITVGVLPSLTEFRTANQISRIHLRPVQIDDLLGRRQNISNRNDLNKLLENKVILVTGGGGSIGSELCRQIATYKPSLLLIIESCEGNLYNIQSEIDKNFKHINSEYFIGDVRNAVYVDKIFAKYSPKIVFHAAAVKHVPIAEYNPVEAISTNVFGSKIVADSCLRYKAELMVLISTDKAVNPTNIMGASKRLAEYYISALGGEQKNETATNFVTVRFGNVLGSSGSVIPLFQQQIHEGGPLTVTHPEVTRYFMTIKEAVSLVLEASLIGVSEDKSHANIYILDMGKSIKIIDLAERMVKLAGLVPYQDIQIEFIGLRPGEKLYEELFYKDEILEKTKHRSINKSQIAKYNLVELQHNIAKLVELANNMEEFEAVKMLAKLLPEYRININKTGDKNE